MTEPPLTLAEEIDALAAECVAGVLDPAERAAVEARMKADAAFRAAVEGWEKRLAALNDDYAPAPVSDAIFARVEARLFPKPDRRRRWMGLFSGAVAAVAMAAAVLMLMPAPMQDVAMLASADHSTVYMVQHKGEMLMVTRMEGTAAPAGQVHELWIIPPGGAPQSLGLLAEAHFEVAYPMPAPGWTLAVSMEPEGGSPADGPTGPVLMSHTIDA